MQKVNTFRDAGGAVYDIPEDETEAFRRDMPQAQAVRVFRDADGALYDIPEAEAEAFTRARPQAEPVRSVRTADGEVFDVPDSEREAFLAGYRHEPEFQADREAVRAKVRSAAGPDESVAGAAARGAVEGLGRGVAAGAIELAGSAAEAFNTVVTRPVARLLGAEGYIAEQKRQEAALRAKASELRGADVPPENIVEQMNRGFAGANRVVGGAIGGAVPLAIAGPVLGPAALPSMGVAGAYGEGGGPREMLEGAVAGAARSAVLGGARILPTAAAGAAGAAGFAAVGALQGEQGEDLMMDALMGGVFAAHGAQQAGGSAARARETLREAVRPLVQSDWWRNLTVRERGMVLRSAEAGRSAEALRNLGAPEALVRQVQGRITEAQRIRAGLRQGDRAAFEAARQSRMAGEATVPPTTAAEAGPQTANNAEAQNRGGAAPVAVPSFDPAVSARVPMLDTSPLPPSPFAAPPKPQPGPTLKAAETLMVNRQVVEGWEAAKARREQQLAQEQADAKQQAIEHRQAVRAGAESKAARTRRLSLDSFWEQHHSTFGGLPMIERILAGQVFRAPNKRAGSEYDDWKALGEKYPELRMMMSRKTNTGIPIDVAALEENMNPEQMVAQIAREWEEYQAWKERDGRMPEDVRNERLADEAQANLTTPVEVAPAALKPGDMVRTPDGQWRRVEREPDTVILADGTDIALPEDSAQKVALQAHVPADKPGINEAEQAYAEQERAMWAEAESERIAAEQAAPEASSQSAFPAEPAAPSLVLEGQTQEQMDTEAAARQTEAQRQEMLARAAAPITGGAGDQTAVLPGMESEVEPNLFDAADIEARKALGMETGDGGRESKAVGSGQVAVGSGQAAVGNGQAAQDARPAAEMTPDEFEVFAVGAAEQQHRRHGTGGPFIINDQIAFRVRSESQHRRELDYALDNNNPVSAAAIDAYGIQLPTGYVREGERYVFKTADIGQTRDFALTARRMVEAGSVRGPKGTEWNVRDERIEVAHSVTGREMGTIDLETGEVTPQKTSDKDVLEAIANEIRAQSKTYANEAELDRLKQYPFKPRNAARIKELEAQAPAQDLRAAAAAAGGGEQETGTNPTGPTIIDRSTDARPGWTTEYSSSDFGTERLVTVRDDKGNIIGQRDPFMGGIPVNPKRRTARIRQVAKEIVRDYDSAMERQAREAAAPSSAPAANAEQAKRANLEAQRQLLLDNMETRRLQGQDSLPGHRRKLAELDALLKGEQVEAGAIASEQLFGHPEATNIGGGKYSNLLPIRVADREKVERYRDRAQKALDEVQSKLSTAEAITKGAIKGNKKQAQAYLASQQAVEDSTVRDLLRHETLPELRRLHDALPPSSLRTDIREPVQAAQAVGSERRTQIPATPKLDANEGLTVRRVVLGRVGEMGNKRYGGAVVSSARLGLYLATQQNSTAPLLEIAASDDPKVWAKHGLRKFDTFDEAWAYAHDTSVPIQGGRETVATDRADGAERGTAAPSSAPAAPESPAQDIQSAAAAAGREGAVRLPQAFSPRLQRAIRRVGALFSPSRGVGEQAYEMVNQMRRSLEAARLSGREARNRIYGIADQLSAQHGRGAVLGAIGDVQEGRATPADFSARFGLAPGNEMERFLGVMVRDTDAASKRILKWTGNSAETRRHADEAKLYQTRAYLLHALGEHYVPPETARRAAVLEVEAGLAEAVERLARQATAVRGRRAGRRLDVVNWLETGDETFLRHASRTRAEAARQLRRNWLELRQVIDGLAMAGDQVTARMNAEAAARAADGIVEYYLQRGAERGGAGTGPGVETGHLRMRFLEGAFRQLYGEITDPAVRQQITTEVQGRMLAEMTLFERIFAECEGTVWARYPDPKAGIMERLGSADSPQDRKRYGDMAGRYVTREFRDLVDTAQHKGSVYQTMQSLYFGPMALQRMGKLLSPKTISRNYITAVTGLAMETGDVFLPGYWGAWAEGHRLAVDYARGRPDAIARIRRLVELGVFQPGASSYTADLQAALGSSGRRMQKASKRITEAYTFIDFPTKYAAFTARQRAGMTAEQAAKHVQDLYQNRERTPPIVGKVSRIGLADYLSYQYDSVRMAANALRFAVDEARQGRVLPLFGWTAARGIFALASVQATRMLSQAAGEFYAQVRQALRNLGDDDKDRDKNRPGITPLDDGQLSRMRGLVAPYDQNAPMLAWREERGGRLERVGYAIAGGQTAFPLDDIITGALQSGQHGQGFLEAVGKSALQLLDQGMYIDAAAKAVGGEGFDGQRTHTGKGLWHARPGQEDPQRSQIVTDAIKAWIADMAPAYPAQMVVQLLQREANQRAGVRDQGIFAREPLSNAEIIARQHRLVRAYTVTRSEMNAQIRNKIMPHIEALGRTRTIVNQAAGMKIEKGAARPGLDEQSERAQEQRARYLGAVARTLQSARAVAPEWFDPGSMLMVLTEAGLPREESMRAVSLANGVAVDTRYMPNPTVSPMQTSLYQQLTTPAR